MQQILSTSYSTSCDSCMFPPEMISPDSSLQGMFVFFICSLYHYRDFLHAPPPVPFMMIPHFSKFDLLLLFILPNYFLVILSSIFSAFFLLSAPCPVAGGSRLGPSSVSGKVTLQLAARSIRGRSLPGRATLTSVPPLSLVQRYAPAGSQMLDWRWKVGGHMISLFLTF